MGRLVNCAMWWLLAIVGVVSGFRWLWEKLPEYADIILRWLIANLVDLLRQTVEDIPEPEPEPPTYWDMFLYDYKDRINALYGLAKWGYGTYLICPLLVYLCRSRLQRTIRQMRGIQLEAMQPGSEFVDGTLPDCQVAIYKMGTLTDTFVGYGVRFKNMLAVPTHVIKLAQPRLLKTDLGSLVVTAGPTLSRLNSDLAYLPLSDSQWSRLGVTSAQTPREVQNALVSCAGRKGVSSGLITQTEIVGILKYAGSTVPGMSGAAYHIGRLVHGIHTGVSGDNNIGISSKLIEQEINRLVVGESPTYDDMRRKVKTTNVKAGWDTQRLKSEINKMYSKDLGWADDIEVDYNQQLNFDGEASEEAVAQVLEQFKKLPAAQREACVAMLGSYNMTMRTATGQSDDPQQIELPKDFVTQRFERIESRLDEIEARLGKKREPKKPEPMISPKPLKCGFQGCYRAFSTETGLMAHKITKQHVTLPIVGESAFSADTVKVVKTNKVFPKRPHWTETSGRLLKASLNSLEPQIPSTSQQASQNEAGGFQDQMLKSLEELQKAMAGLSSVITLKCKV